MKDVSAVTKRILICQFYMHNVLTYELLFHFAISLTYMLFTPDFLSYHYHNRITKSIPERLPQIYFCDICANCSENAVM